MLSDWDCEGLISIDLFASRHVVTVFHDFKSLGKVGLLKY